MIGHSGPVKPIGCLLYLVVIFLPPLAMILRPKGVIPFIVVLFCTILFYPLGSIAAAIYFGD